MLTWNEIVQDHIIKNSDKIQRISKPLHEHFGITYFTYHRIDLEGKYTVLVDRPDYAEHYVGNKFFLQDPYLRHPDVYSSGITLIQSHGSPEYLELLSSAEKQLQCNLGIVLIEKHADSVEFFGFAGKKESSGLEKLYLNHSALLKSFGSYFKQQLHSELLHMEEAANTLLQLKGPDFLSPELIRPDIQWDAYLSYLRDMGLASEVVQAAQLAPREKQCMKLLVRGYSAKDTARALKLSHRTVECYLENIRKKLSCPDKARLFALAKKLEELKLLP